MNELRVLNFTQIVFPSLPPLLSSLACLSNLRTLSLIDCDSIVDVALVGELKMLEILSFRGSDIEQLPMKIGQLTLLKKLDLSHCSELNVIAPNVISKLTRLEELCMVNSFTQWEKGEGGSNASLVELNALSELTTLEINIPDVKIVPRDLVSEELERFKILLGDKELDSDGYWDSAWFDAPKTSRTLKFKGLVKSSHFGQRMKTLLKRAEELYLDEPIGFRHFHELDDGEGFPQLKYLSLKSIPKISYIVNLGKDCCNVFSSLDSLSLRKLMNLEKICHGQLNEDQSFSKLRVIKVEECHELKHLLSFSMAKNLSGLREIELTNCKGLKLIVGEERENYIVCENEGINFTQLHSLSLTGLPQLRCSGFNLEISRRLSATSSSASKEIVAENDPQDFVTVLFNNKVTFPNLNTLELSSLNIENIWPDQFSTCENLTTLEVKGCHHLKFLFSYSMVGSLMQLQNLVIEGCESMECVINTSGLRIDEQMSGVMVFSKLKSLILSRLSNLTRFGFMNSSDMQSFFNGKIGLPRLEILTIRRLPKLRKIWHHQLDFDSFSELKQLEVVLCDKVMNIFPSNIILGRRFRRLKEVRVIGCGLIKEIIEEETSPNNSVDVELPRVSTSTGTSRFQVLPQLTSMALMHVPNFTSIYQGVHMLEWPMLKNLEIHGSSKFLSFERWIQQGLSWIDYDELRRLVRCSSTSNEIAAEDDPTVLFDKLTFPILATLTFSSLNIQKIWPDQFSTCQNLTELRVQDCRYMKFLFSCSMILSLVQLQNLVIEECESIKCIINTNGLRRDEQQMIGGMVFPKLKSLMLSGLPYLTRFVSMGSLEENSIMHFDINTQSLFNEEVTLPTLETMKLSALNIEKIWPEQFSTCENLTKLEVKDCVHLKFLFPYSMVPNIVQLQNLVIEGCESMECVINTNGLRRDEEQMIGVTVFLELKSLILSNLPNLTRFDFMSFPEENNIIHSDINTESLFNEKVIFPILETLKLSSLNIQKIWPDQFSTCQNLTELKVKDCRHMKFLFSYSMVLSLVQLQDLVIEECKSVECVINTNGLRRDKEQMIGVMVLPKLESLSLLDLPNLTRFVSMNSSEQNNIMHSGINTQFLFNEEVGLPNLETLRIDSLSNLRKIWHHHLHSDSFNKLKKLEVGYCDKIINIFSSNIILGRRFQRLEEVTVRCCKLLKEITEEETSSNLMVDEEVPIANTSTDTTRRFQVFSQLASMKLHFLSGLKSIYQGVRMLEWPALKNLFVENCGKVEILIDHHKVAFPNLKDLTVRCCNELKNLMTISTVESLVELKKISISNCNMIEEIIQEVGEMKVDHVVFSQLECLELDNLPRLKHFFGRNCTLEFPYLRQVVVSGCLNMKIFSQGVLLTPKLQKVQLADNYLLKNELRSNVQILLALKPLLNVFYNSIPSQDPRGKLQKAQLANSCLELQNVQLADNYLQEDEERWEGSLNSTVQKMFEEMAGINGLHILILSQVPRVKEIWYDQTIPGNVFSSLRALAVDDCKFVLSAIPANRLRFLKNLTILRVNNCDSVEEVVHIEELNTDEHSVQLFPNLWELSLINLPKLKKFCNFSGNIIELAYLQNLTIENCPNVETFISNSSLAQPLFNEKVIFPNLEKLAVCNCEGLRNLMTLSTVESLVKLKRIKIYSCGMIEEIVLPDGEVKVDPIFSQLESLELCDLPRLKHFFWGNCTLKFPYLEEVVVSGCLNMKIFSQGALRTPKLQKVQLTNNYEENEGQENGERWEGSLNSTIQKMFEEMAGFYGLDTLILSQVPQVKEIWHGQTIPVGYFCNLLSLVVDDCKLMSSAIPINVLRLLKNLKCLEVMNCDSAEEVFHMEELNADEYSVQLFPNLLDLYLIDLPNLKRFCNFSWNIIELPSLELLCISNCPTMETFISISTDDKPLFNEKVALHNLKWLELSKLSKLHLCKENSSPINVFQNLETLNISECSKLEHVVPSWVSFQNLMEMEVSKCDGLITLMTFSTAKSLMKLESMKITNCKMIEEIIHAGEEVKKDSIVFSKLEYLELSSLPSLAGFFLGNYTLEFPCLKQVIVKECLKMEIFSRGILSTPKLEGLKLPNTEEEEIVKKDEWLWEGSLNSTIQKLFEEKNVQRSKDEDE